jgi:hypothetical protein
MACHLGQTPLGCWVHGSDLGHVHVQLAKTSQHRALRVATLQQAQDLFLAYPVYLACMVIMTWLSGEGMPVQVAGKLRNCPAQLLRMRLEAQKAVQEDLSSSLGWERKEVQQQETVGRSRLGLGVQGAAPCRLPGFLQGKHRCFRNEAGAFVLALALGAGVGANDPCCLGCSTVSWDWSQFSMAQIPAVVGY